MEAAQEQRRAMEEEKRSSATLWFGLGIVLVGYSAELIALAFFTSRNSTQMGLPDWVGQLCFFGFLPMILFGGYLLTKYKRRSPLWALAAPLWLPGFIILAVLLVLPPPEDYQARG